MSKTVDTKIVEMKFDNSKFEQNVKTSINTLGKLKSALSFDSSAKKSFQNIETESAKVDFNALNKAIETVNKRFSLLGEIGTRVLHNITDRAVEAGSKAAKALTVQGASDGFKEYELKMGSIQTIMNATGADVQTVNKYLDELNEYSDKTIYSFSDMTQNIGKFANAGVDLKTSVKAIQGVSNAAALAGANSEEASRAMYNISQALSSGVMLNIDWRSIENANMATMEFKQALIDTAVECGTLQKTADGMYRSLTTDNQGNISDAFNAGSKFRDNLKSQWMTAEVLTKTLGRYSNELDPLGKRAFQAATEVKTFSMMMDATKEAIGSGWAKTWELVFGDFEEAKTLWTSLSEVIGGFVKKTSDARNGILQVWHDDINGRATFLLGIREAFEAVSRILKPMKQAFKEVFPPITAQHLLKFSVAFENAMYRIKFSKTTLKNIHDAFKGFFSVIKLGIDVVKAFIKATFNSRSGFSKLGSIILTVAGSIGRFVSKVADIIKKNNVLYRVFSKLYEILGKVLSPFGKLYKYLTESGKVKRASDSFLKFFDAFTKPGAQKMKVLSDFLKTLISKIPIAGGLINKFIGFVKTLFDTLITKSGVLDKLKTAFKDCKSPLEILGTLFGTVKEKAGNFFEIINNKFNVVDKLKTAVSNCSDPFKTFSTLAGTAAEKIKEFFSHFSEEKNTLIEKAKTAIENIPNPLKLISEFASTAAEKVKGFFSQFSITSIKETASSIDILGKIGRAFEKISSFAGNAFNITKDILSAVGKSIKEGFSQLSVNDVSKFIESAAKVLALLFASKMFKELGKAFKQAGNTFDILGDSLKSLTGKTNSGKLLDVAKAVAMLAASVYMIGTLPSDKIGQASQAIITLGAALIFVGKYINKAGIKDFKKPAASMAVFAVAIGILALSVSSLAKLKGDILQGLGSVVILIAALSLFSNLLPILQEYEKMPSMVGIIAVAIGVRIVAGAIGKLAGLEKGVLEGVGVILALSVFLGALSFVVGKSNMTASAGAGLMLVSTGILVISKAIASIAKTASTYKDSYENVMNTLIIILGGFSLLAVATNKHAKSILALGPSLLLVSAGLGIIALAIRSMAGLDFMGQIVPGLGSMVVMLLAIAGMVKLMGKGSGDMLKVGTGILEISAAMVVFGAAIRVIGSIPISVLAQGLITMAGALVFFGIAAFALNKLGIAATFEGIGKTMLKFGAGVLALAAGLAILSPLIVAIPGIFMAMAVGIVAAVGIILAGIVGLSALIGAALAALVKVICKVIVSSANDIKEALEALLSVIIMAIRGSGLLLAEVLVEIILVILAVLELHLEEIANRLVRMVVKLIYSICEALKKNSKAIMYTLSDVIYTIISFIMKVLKQALLTFVPLPKLFRDKISAGFDKATDGLKSMLKVEEGQKYMKKWSRSLGDEIARNKQYNAKQATDLGNVMKNGVVGGSDGMLSNVLGNFTQMNAGMNRLFHPFKSTTSKYKTEIFDSLVFNGGDFADTSLSEYGDTFEEYLPIINKKSGFLGKTVGDNLDIADALEKYGVKGTSSWDKGLMSNREKIKIDSNGLQKTVTGELSKAIPIANRIGVDISSNNAKGVESGSSKNKDAAFKVKNSVVNELKKAKPEAERSGSATSAGHAFGVQKGTPKARAAAKQNANAVINEYEKAKQPVRRIANQTTAGYNNEIRSAASTTANAVKSVVNSALNSARRVLGIHSPSKEFEKIGAYCVAGMNSGLKSNSKKAAKTSGSVAKTISKSFSGSLKLSSNSSTLKKNKAVVAKTVDAVTKQVKNGVNSKPKITPVLDAKTFTKDLKKTKKNIDKFEGNILVNGSAKGQAATSTKTKTDAFSGNILLNGSTKGQYATSKNDSTKKTSTSSSGYNSNSDYSSTSSSSASSNASSITQDHLNALKSFAAANKYTQNNILDQVRKVRQDINQLTSTMAAMKIQLDTGALVGNLVVPMDKALAKQANLNERR